MLFIFHVYEVWKIKTNNTKHFSFNLRFQKLFSLFLFTCKTNTTCLSKTGISQLHPAVSYLSLPLDRCISVLAPQTCRSEQPFDSIWRELWLPQLAVPHHEDKRPPQTSDQTCSTVIHNCVNRCMSCCRC